MSGSWPGALGYVLAPEVTVKSLHFQHPFPGKLKKLWSDWWGWPRLHKLSKLQQRWREWLEAVKHVCGRASNSEVLVPKPLLWSLEAQLLHCFCPGTLNPITSLLKALVSSPAGENHCPSVLGRGIFKTYINVEISTFIWIRNSKLGLPDLKHTMYCSTKTANNGFFGRVFHRLLVRGSHVRVFSFPASACYVQRFQRLLDKEKKNLSWCGQE